MFILRSCDGMLAKAYERAGVPPPESEHEPSYMQTEKAWCEEARRRVLRCFFFASRAEATRFPSEADAWAAFDAAGYCGREYYVIEPV